MARRTLCFLLLLLLSPSARAIDSLDWLIADSDLVIRGRVIMVVLKTTPKNGHYDWEEATITVYETLKGTPPKFDQIKVLRPTSHFKSAPWSEDPSLFLLVAGRRAAYLDSPDFLEGRYLMIDPYARIISLKPGAHDGNWVFNPIYSAAGQRLRDPEDILDTAHDTVTTQRNGHRRLPPAILGITNSKALTVPADENWQRRAEEQLASGQPLYWISELLPDLRGLLDSNGEYHQQPRDYFKNDQTITFLCHVLDDPWGEVALTDTYHWPTPLDDFENRHHFNRRLARQVLSSWDIVVPPPVIDSPLLQREPIPPNPYLLAALCLIFLPILTARRKPLFLRTLTWLCTLLTFATLFLWLRSASRYDSLIYATHSFEHEISSSFGQIHYLALTGGPPADHPLTRTPSHASVSLKDIDLVPHHLNYLLPDHQWNHAGIALAQGLTPPTPGRDWPATPAVSYSYRLITLRYPWLVALFFSLPALRA